jgi:hypothetical protein
MTKYEELMATYGHLLIEERPMINKGLYADGCIWIREDLLTKEKYCMLAEELGHYETSEGDILNQDIISNRKQELTARRWAYETIVPRELIENVVRNGYTEIWDIADQLDLDENFLKDALEYYGYWSA